MELNYHSSKGPYDITASITTDDTEGSVAVALHKLPFYCSELIVTVDNVDITADLNEECLRRLESEAIDNALRH